MLQSCKGDPEYCNIWSIGTITLSSTASNILLCSVPNAASVMIHFIDKWSLLRCASDASNFFRKAWHGLLYSKLSVDEQRIWVFQVKPADVILSSLCGGINFCRRLPMPVVIYIVFCAYKISMHSA